MMIEEPPPPQPRVRLRFLQSPLLNKDRDSTDDLKHPVYQNDSSIVEHERPILERHDDANLLEVFYDLFFAANYGIFTKNQSIYGTDQLASHASYFSILWMTWLITAFFDVRYATDSVFERMAKGAQLGVLVGLAIVTPNFNPIEQDAQTMKTMSLILMVSRLTLAIEYGTIVWHVRKFKNAGLGLYIQIGICVAAAVAYLGVAFRFTDGNSRIFITWYIVGVLEVLLTFLLSAYCLVTSFTRTHLMKRLTFLTVIILGDGIVSMAEKILIIVKAPDPWDSVTIGLVTAATCIVYFIFFLYFDWIRDSYLPIWRQQIWVLLHFPFHLALVLWQTCFAQFIIWSKIYVVREKLTVDDWLSTPENFETATSLQVADKWAGVVTSWAQNYPLKWQQTITAVQAAMTNITDIPDEFWPTYGVLLATGDSSDLDLDLTETYENLTNIIFAGLETCVYATYDIDLLAEQYDSKKSSNDTAGWEDGTEQLKLRDETAGRLAIVWTIGYTCIGLVLVLMTILSIITRRTSWKAWPIIRVTINFLLSIGVGLTVLVGLNGDYAEGFLESHMTLPIICIVMFTMLVLTHIRSESPAEVFKRSATFLSARRRNTDKSVEAQYIVAPKYDPVESR